MQIPQPEQIARAEDARVHRRWTEVTDILDPIMQIVPGDISHVALQGITDESTRLLTSARILLVAKTSSMQEETQLPEAYTTLGDALIVHERFYTNPEMRQIRRDSVKDVEGNPFAFDIEMMRDSARLCIAAAEITGNTALLEAGVRYLDRAIATAIQTPPHEATIIPLLQFQRERDARRLPRTSKLRRGSLREQRKYASRVVTAAIDEKNYERAATVLSWQILDEQEGSKSRKNLEQRFGRIIPEYSTHILSDQQVKLAGRSNRLAGWGNQRRTAPVPEELAQALIKLAQEAAY